MRERATGPFFWLTLGYLVLAGGTSALFPRDEVHLAINRVNTPFLDHLFPVWTYLGDGWVLAGLVAAALFLRIRWSFAMLASYLISGLLVQLLKRRVFDDSPRPLNYFRMEGRAGELHLVEGVDLNMWLSFPSGHTASAFAVLFGLSLFLYSRSLKVLLFVLALGVALSRVYLSQHFLIDTVGGALLGLAGGYAGWYWISRWKRSWLDRSVTELQR